LSTYKRRPQNGEKKNTPEQVPQGGGKKGAVQTERKKYRESTTERGPSSFRMAPIEKKKYQGGGYRDGIRFQSRQKAKRSVGK